MVSMFTPPERHLDERIRLRRRRRRPGRRSNGSSSGASSHAASSAGHRPRPAGCSSPRWPVRPTGPRPVRRRACPSARCAQVAVGALDFRAGRTLVQAEKRPRLVTIHAAVLAFHAASSNAARGAERRRRSRRRRSPAHNINARRGHGGHGGLGSVPGGPPQSSSDDSGRPPDGCRRTPRNECRSGSPNTNERGSRPPKPSRKTCGPAR